MKRLLTARTWLPVAVSALLVVALFLWRDRQRASLRGGTRPSGPIAALVLLEPVGPIADPPRQFRWTRDAGAERYRVELFDQNAQNVGVAVTNDTVLAAGALSNRTLNAGQWRVVPIGADGVDLPRHVRAVFVVAR